MGRRIWVVIQPYERPNPETGGTWKHGGNVYDCRVLSFQKFLPADGEKRKKHLVQVWTDPGGTRVLTVGSIRLKDPGRVEAALLRAEREREEATA